MDLTVCHAHHSHIHRNLVFVLGLCSHSTIPGHSVVTVLSGIAVACPPVKIARLRNTNTGSHMTGSILVLGKGVECCCELQLTITYVAGSFLEQETWDTITMISGG